MTWHAGAYRLAGVVMLAILWAATDGAAVKAALPSGVCRPGYTNDALMPLPADLVSKARQLFQLDMPDKLIRRSTVYRCSDGRMLLCTTGANLPCGKANTSRDLPAAVDWCRDHQGAESIPMFVTGHDSIYRWRCWGGQPRIVNGAETVDGRGFIARFWKDAGLKQP